MKELLWVPPSSHLFEVIWTGGTMAERRCVAAVRKMYLSLWADPSYLMREPFYQSLGAPLLNLHDYFRDNSKRWYSARCRPLTGVFLESSAITYLFMQQRKAVITAQWTWWLSLLPGSWLGFYKWPLNAGCPSFFTSSDLFSQHCPHCCRYYNGPMNFHRLRTLTPKGSGG